MNYSYLGLLLFGSALSFVIPLKMLLIRGPAALALQPFIFFSLYFFLIHFLTPLIKHLNDYYRYQESYDEMTFILNAILCIVLYLMAYGLSKSKMFVRGNRKSYVRSYRGIRDAYWLGALLYAIGFIIAIRDLSIINDLIGLEVFNLDKHAASMDRGALRSFTTFMIIGSILFLAGWNNRKNGRMIFILIYSAMILFSVFYYSVLSSRNNILILFVFNVTCWYLFIYNGSGLNLNNIQVNKIIAISLLVGLLFFGAYYLTIVRYSVTDTKYYTQKRENITLSMLDGAFGNDEALLWLAEHSYNYRLGKTYLAGFTNLVPRSIWKDKPLGGGPDLINMIRPGAYIRGAYGNNSLTTGFLTEGRMNFGILGMFVAIFSWAFLSTKLLEMCVRARTRISQVTFLLLSLLFSSLFLYAEFLGFIVRCFFITIAGIFGVFFFNFLRHATR